MTSKDLLIKDRDLKTWWNEIASDPRFDKLYMVMQSDIMKMGTAGSIDKMNGAMELFEALRSVAVNEPERPGFPSPGLQHHNPEPVKHGFKTS